jgi:hypothetical protein
LVVRQPQSRRSGRRRVETAVLSALVGVALCMSAVSDSQVITLCVSSEGRLNLEHVTRSCHRCPNSSCPSETVSVESQAADLSGHDSCCVDIPLKINLVGWFAPRSIEPGDDDSRLVVADRVRSPIAVGAAALRPGGLCALLVPDREPPALTMLAGVVLLL